MGFILKYSFVYAYSMLIQSFKVCLDLEDGKFVCREKSKKLIYQNIKYYLITKIKKRKLSFPFPRVSDDLKGEGKGGGRKVQ